MPAGGKGLRVGQTVTLAEGTWGWRLTEAPGQGGHQVVAVETGHVVLVEADTGTTRRLPLYLVETVVPAEPARGEAA